MLRLDLERCPYVVTGGSRALALSTDSRRIAARKTNLRRLKSATSGCALLKSQRRKCSSEIGIEARSVAPQFGQKLNVVLLPSSPARTYCFD
jgi:hypothetical protein